MNLFITAFAQVFLVVLNTYFISNSFELGIAICGFFISFVWSYNVRKVAFGTITERIVYSLGAMAGSLAAFYLGQMILK